MIIHKTTLKLRPDQNLLLIPIGDIQSDSEYDRLEKLVAWCLEREKGGHIVRLFGMGDYFETFSPSERATLKAGKSGYGLHETTQEWLDAAVQDRADTIYSIVKPLTGRFLGLLRGHHKHDFFVPKDAREGLTTDLYLCHKLNCTYFGSVVVIKLLINGLPFTIFATHGYGNARTPGARLAKRLRMREVYLDANWYVMGHDNEKVVYPIEGLFTDPDGSLHYLKQYFSGSGSFQRSYESGKADGGYAEDALYPPSSLGVVICSLKVEKKNGRSRLDYHVSA